MSEPIYSPVTMGPIEGVAPGGTREMGPPRWGAEVESGGFAEEGIANIVP